MATALTFSFTRKAFSAFKIQKASNENYMWECSCSYMFIMTKLLWDVNLANYGAAQKSIRIPNSMEAKWKHTAIFVR